MLTCRVTSRDKLAHAPYPWPILEPLRGCRQRHPHVQLFLQLLQICLPSKVVESAFEANFKLSSSAALNKSNLAEAST
jgi:hypothetical protein